jgi:hypothetical protein
MRLKLRFDSLKETKPTEYVSRLVFGGVVTVLAGFVGDHYGPVVGGLFLAFPGIFPAGVSLVEKHKTQREKAEGKRGIWSARGQASVEATGASVGTLGLIGFAVAMARTANAQLPAYGVYRDRDVDCCVCAVLVDAREDVDDAFRCDMNACAPGSDTSCTLKECINPRTSLNWSVFR